MRKFESPLDRTLREAREQGKFDDLPQHGKPIKVKINPLTGDIAEQLLEDADCDPPWLEAQREIDYMIGEARHNYQRSMRIVEQQKAAVAQASAAERIRSLQSILDREQTIRNKFVDAITEINKKIFDYNLIAPDLQIHRLKLDFSTELTTLDAERAA